MSRDFDEFPLYDPLVRAGTDSMSDIWVSFIATFYQTLITYLSSNGIFLPQLTTAQRNMIQSPVNGQMIYNTTLSTAQYWNVSAWVNF